MTKAATEIPVSFSETTVKKFVYKKYFKISFIKST